MKDGHQSDKDLWYVEFQYVRAARVSADHLSEIRKLLLLLWDSGRELELDRIRSIKNLYEDIVSHNSKIFGEHEAKINVL